MRSRGGREFSSAHPPAGSRRSQGPKALIVRSVGPEHARKAEQQTGPAPAIGEHIGLAPETEWRDQNRLLGAVLAYTSGPVARAQARLLPAAHGNVESKLEQQRRVDGDTASVQPSGNLPSPPAIAGESGSPNPILG